MTTYPTEGVDTVAKIAAELVKHITEEANALVIVMGDTPSCRKLAEIAGKWTASGAIFGVPIETIVLKHDAAEIMARSELAPFSGNLVFDNFDQMVGFSIGIGDTVAGVIYKGTSVTSWEVYKLIAEALT
ncbi:MAG: hypothetical protein QE269_13110 [Fimbriimonas sp.]|nr:hypothetical protein [Fimbriimonas sp.]